MKRVFRALLAGAVLSLAFAGCSPPGGRVAPEVQSIFSFAAYPGATTESELSVDAGGTGFLGLEPGKYGRRVQRTTDQPAKILAYYKALAAQHGWRYEETTGPTEDSCQGMRYGASMNVERFNLDINLSPEKPVPGIIYGYSDACPETPPPTSAVPEPGPSVGSVPEASPPVTPVPQPTPSPPPFWYIEQGAETGIYRIAN